MSKIFEALQKTEGELAAIANVVLDGHASDPNAGRSVSNDPETEPREMQPGYGDTIRSATVTINSGSPLLPFHCGDEEAAEQYRIIRTKVDHFPGQPRIVLISSAMPNDGKTVTAINLAAALSLQENQRVLLLDCDFRHSSAMTTLGLPTAPGLGEVLRGEAAVGAALVQIEQFPNLYVLPPGDMSAGPAELLSSARWHSLMDLCREEFRFVVLDAPPVGSVAEYDLLQLACDGIVLVVRQDHTNRQLWRRALDTVPKEKQIGVILNCAQKWFLWKTHAYYGYYSAGNSR